MQAVIEEQSFEEITGPSVWYGPDLADSREWIYHLDQEDIAEIEAALKAAEESGRDIIQLERSDFALPRLGPELEQIRDACLNGRGFALVKGLPIERYSRWQAACIFWGIGRHLGSPRSQNGKGHLLGHVRDLGYDLNDPAVRIYQTTKRQTYHTDSCDIVALLCLHPAKSGGYSSIVSSMTIHNEMLRRRPDLLAELYRPLATDRRGEVPPGQKPWFELPVFNPYQGLISVIYQRQYIDSAQRFEAAPRLSARQVEALDLFDALAGDKSLRLDMTLEKGDMQFVCNHTLLHDRTDFEDWPEPERKRHLLRLWLCPEVGRPLPPGYAQRYGSVEIGDRGGIILQGTEPTLPLEPV